MNEDKDKRIEEVGKEFCNNKRNKSNEIKN